MAKDTPKILCRRTQTRCGCGPNHYYYECGEHLLCLPDGATDIKISSVVKGSSPTIVGSKISGTYKIPGSTAEQPMACEGIGEASAGPEPIEGVLDTPVGVLCVRTQTKCTCDNQAGYMYDCGAAGMACLPISLANVQVVSVAKTGKRCDAKRCKFPGGEEATFTLIVRGSLHPRKPIESKKKPTKAKPAKAKGRAAAKTKGKAGRGRGHAGG